MAETTREESHVPQQLELSAKSLRIRGDGSAIHLGMVVSFVLVAALPFVLDRFTGAGILALAVVLATFVLIAFVVDRVAPQTAGRRQYRPFRSNARSAKIPPSSGPAAPERSLDTTPSATRTRNACSTTS